MSKTKKLFASTASVALVAAAIVPAASAAQLNDIEKVPGYAKEAVQFLADNNILKGDENGNFNPAKSLSRAEAAQVLMNALDLKAEGTEEFSDVSAKDWFYDAVVATSPEIFNGDDNGKFNPKQNLTREAAAKVLVDAYGFTGSADLSNFADASKVSKWATSYVAIAVENEIISGKGNLLAPQDKITRAEFATMVKRAMDKVEDTTPTPELTVDSVVAIDANTIEVTFEDGTVEEITLDTELVDGATEVTFEFDGKEYTEELEAPYKAPVVELAVESVDAINSKTLKLNLTSAADEKTQKAAEFTVKRGNAIVSVTAEWAADGKSVELVSGANLLAGDYTVTISNIEGEATTTVTAVTPTTLGVAASILNDETAKSKLNVELKDQYGEKIALSSSAFTATAFNKTQGAAVTLGFNTTDGYYVDTEATPDAFKVNDVITVTFIHNATGLKVTKELKVVAGAILSTVDVGAIELPKDKTLLTADLTNVKAELTTEDQFGNDVQGTLGANGNLTVISSDETVVSASDVTIITEDEKQKLNISNIKKSGKVTLTVLVKATGETAKLTLDILAAPGEVTSATLEETEGTVAAGSTKEVALKVYDNYSNEVKFADYDSVLAVSSSNTAVVPAANVDINSDGKLEFTVASGASKNATATLNVVDATGKVYASYVVTAGETAVATSIEVAETSKHTTKLAVNASTTPVFEVKDQYGNTIDSLASGYTVTYKSKNDSTNITVNPSTGAVTANKVGTASIVAELNKDGVAIASKEIAFTIVENNSTGVQIADIATLAQTTAAASGEVGAYYEEIKVVSETGAALPAASILSVTSSNENFVKVAQVDGKWYAYGVDVDQVNSKDVDTKATISVIYNADDKPVTLTKEVTVSATAIAAKEILVNDKKLTTDNKVDKDAVTVTSVSVKDFAELADLDIFAAVKDNYNRLNAATTGTSAPATDIVITVNNQVGFTTSDTITIGADGELDFSNLTDELATSTDGKASFRIILTKGTVVKAIDVNLTAATTVTQAAVTAATNAVVAAETSTLQADVDAAQALVTALPADVAPATTKADLQARLDAILVTP